MKTINFFYVFIIPAWKRVNFSGMKRVTIKTELRKLNRIKGLPIYTPSSCPHLPEFYLTSIPHKHPVSTSSTGRVTFSWMWRMTSPTCSVPFCLSHFNFTVADSNIICQFLCQETSPFFCLCTIVQNLCVNSVMFISTSSNLFSMIFENLFFKSAKTG